MSIDTTLQDAPVSSSGADSSQVYPAAQFSDHHPRERKFGFRVPEDGSPVPFRVLIGRQWVRAAIVAAVVLAGIAPRLTWRQRLHVLMGGVGALLAGIGVGLAQARRVAFERHTLEVPELPPALDGFRIIQITDLHLGSLFTVANLQRTLAWVREQQPDLVVFTGDFISYNDKLPLLREHLHGISAPHGVYAIFGNHDYWTDIAALEQVLRGHGIEVLRNEQRTLRVGDATLYLVGIDCIWESLHDLAAAFADVPADAPTIVLAHEPDIADEVARFSPTLQLSGHTHAGHITAPLLGPLFLPRHGLRYFQGLHRVGRMWLYISRGLGGYPLRFGCPPEVTEFTLKQG